MSLKVKKLIKQLKRFYLRAWFLVFSKHCARSVDYFNLTRKKLVLKRVFLNKERQLLIGSVVNTPQYFLAWIYLTFQKPNSWQTQQKSKSVQEADETDQSRKGNNQDSEGKTQTENWINRSKNNRVILKSPLEDKKFGTVCSKIRFPSKRLLFSLWKCFWWMNFKTPTKAVQIQRKFYWRGEILSRWPLLQTTDTTPC